MEEKSAFPAVAKACLQIAQWSGPSSSGGGGSSASAADDSTTVSSSGLAHEASLSERTMAAAAALSACSRHHSDRRCRKLSLQTLAITARGTYALLRPSLLLYHAKHSHPHRLEEELSMDVPSTLIAAALSDPDDGVSSSAVEALGILILHSSCTTSTYGEDELLRECAGILGRPTPYAPSLRAVSEEDPATPALELSLRVLERAILPRLVQLVDRVSGYTGRELIVPTLPVLTVALVHAVRTTVATWHGLDRAAYAKRWTEADALGLADTAATQLLLPLLETACPASPPSATQPAAALALLRLAHACPHRPWVVPSCRGAARALLPTPTALEGLDLETKLAQLAYLTVALRPLPSVEKVPYLQSLATVLAGLPSTVRVPPGIVSPGVPVEFGRIPHGKRGHHQQQIRKPTRTGLWTEVALSLVLDGPPELPRTGSGASNGGGGTLPPRVAALHTLLTTGAVGKIVSERVGFGGGGMITLYDELLLAFATAAVEASRRFRGGGLDGTARFAADEHSPLLLEWVQLAGVVLTAFAPCVQMGHHTNGTKSEVDDADDLSLLTAGQASYVCLLQEYLFPAGFLNADSCVSVKLTGNACPPHLLWDQVAAASAVLSRLEAEPNDDLEATTSRLVDELVAREAKQGSASHTLRMYLLTLASDHWIQGRISSVRKHFDSRGGDGASAPVLRGPSGRDIALALSPRRVLAKLVEGQPTLGPDEPKRKRDTARKLAQDTVKTCVACIEGIALMACDWRRRFGASPETKQLVSVSVGLLQGKVDETPVDDTMKAMLGPICDAAVTRIQAFYESEGGGGDPMELNFPVSDLLAQPVKPKIKPFIATSRPATTPRDKVARYHLLQLCRQTVSARAEQAMNSFPVADSILTNARSANYLRLSVPPLTESKDARLLGNFGQPLASWGTAVNLSSAASDAAALIAAYTHRRYARHDGEDEYRLTVLLRAFNATPISFAEGLRLELGLVERLTDFGDAEDPLSAQVVESLGGDVQSLSPDLSVVSSLAVYNQELQAGDFVTWEVSLDRSTILANSVLVPSISYRNVEVEPIEAGAKWVGDKKSSLSGDASTTTGGGESKSGEDDFQVTTSDKANRNKGEDLNTELVTLPGESLFLTPFIGLQPCPMVFFRDSWGDVTTFRMFWFNMAHHVAPIRLHESSAHHEVSPIDERIATMSRLRFRGEAIPGGVASKLWAFTTLSGSRVYCVLAENEQGKSSSQTLHIRGDDKRFLFSLIGSKSSRDLVVATLCCGALLGP